MSTESGMVLVPRDDLEKWIDRIGIPKDIRYAMQSRLDEHDIGSALAAAPASPPTPAVDGLNFVSALKITTAVFEQYRLDQPKWWKRMDGTPILNDVAVRMARAFLEKPHVET